METTIFDALKGLNAYPVPKFTLQSFAKRRGIELMKEATSQVLESKSFLLAKADVLSWLSLAPIISQGGQKYSFTDKQREDFNKEALSIYKKHGDEADKLKTGAMGENVVEVEYGYVGEDL